MDRGRRSNRRNYRQKFRSSREMPRAPPIIQQAKILNRTELPIYKDKQTILDYITKYSIGIVEAATGSGKSTQIPQYILERFPDSEIIVAQTNKPGANEVASRVAEEIGCQIGGTVGIIFKGENKTSDQTKIFFTTTDILLEFSLNDNFKWDFVIIDEVHERSLETDILLSVLKIRLNEGKKFKLMIMSATIQNILPSYFSTVDNRRLFEGKSDFVNWGGELDDMEEEKIEMPKPRPIKIKDKLDIVQNQGRIFEIEEIYLVQILEIVSALNNNEIIQDSVLTMDDFSSLFEKDADTNPREIPPLMYELGCRIILTQHLNLFRKEESPFTFLVFLPGYIEITYMYDNLMSVFKEKSSELEIITLHTNVSEEEYNKIFTPPEGNKRRVILSTNIAESSITITDVRFIIDFGMNLETTYSKARSSDTFDLVWSAKSVMKQRAGRAGRVANGIVFRLMPTQFFQSMLYDYSRPEIKRSSLDKVILKLKMKSIENLKELLGNILEAPDEIEILKTEKHLIQMGGLDSCKKITNLGVIYTEFPFEIHVIRLCMFGILFRCFNQTLKIGAIISLEKGPIKSFAGLPNAKSKDHPLTYISRLIFDDKKNSDLMMVMHAYDKWFFEYGFKMKNLVFNNGHRANFKPRILEGEIEFCNKFHLDSNVMRDILCLYCELEHKFSSIRLDPDHLKVSSENSEFALKLCIAAAYPGKYLISNYEITDEIGRNKLICKIGNDPTSTILIPDVDRCIAPSDIEGLLNSSREKPKSVSISYSNVLVSYKNDVNPNSIKFAL